MVSAALPWLKEYNIFGIPQTLNPYPDKPAYDILYETARRFKKQGLVQIDYFMSYPEVKNHVDRLATVLFNMGLKKGDRVATLLPTSIQFVIADYAISRAGLVHIPSSSLEPADHLQHKFKEGSPYSLICLDEYLDVVKNIVQHVEIKNIIVSKLDDYSLNKPKSYEPLTLKGAQWWTELISKTPPSPPEITFDVAKDLELILFTGGTTGLPKGCMLTHRNVYANTMQNANAMGGAQKLVKGALTVLMGLPFFHSYGHCTMHTMTYEGYNQILIPDARDTASMVRMIKEYHPFLQIGVPTQFLKLTQGELKDVNILGISGSAPLPKTVQEEFEKKGGGGGIMEGYGLSEMSPVTHLNTSFLLRILGGRTLVKINSKLLQIPGVVPMINNFLRLLGSRNTGFMMSKGMGLLSRLTANKATKPKKVVEKRGTIGVPMPDTEIKIVDIDTGAILSWDEIVKGKTGEMYLRGPQRMLGYWPTPGSGLDEEGYVHTGDVVKVDENGYFYIVDRTKDMIIVSGFKVYSREIDDILQGCPGVGRAATIGIPDPERQGSERVCVFVEPQNGCERDITEEKIINYLKNSVAKYAVPKVVKIVESIPLTEVQKVNKKLLRQIAEKEAAGKKADGASS
ncbi:MAG: AMP-dependent synthetase [Deltaproteobacteria bacterium HGW-Deltaproteobacteria-2]|jgi:acyl-CoA synthetase (AMP-forming)/AMP-acid ligase II|nr:MAG: AMP-dependent synthetase [Deltaproteobacteria bacterium HGW-Deltaproteobacteria-2]